MASASARQGWGVFLLVALGLWAVAAQAQVSATLIDRQGNRHEVEQLKYKGLEQIDYYVDGQRQLVRLSDIRRFVIEGNAGDEQQPVVVTLRSGRVERGTVFAGTGSTPHDDAVGGGGGFLGFEGRTSLGPLLIQLSEVRELIVKASDATADAAVDVPVRATIITVEGERFEVTDLKYRNSRRMTYYIGQKRRYAGLDKLEQIDFAEGSANEEVRPLTFTYWTGRKVQGTVEASVVRLSGETDRNYFDRVHAALTGTTSTGAFHIGLHAIKQIRFKAPDEEEPQPDTAAEPEETPVVEQ